MPINILSLPDKDIKYTLNCMDIEDFMAFSLCSKHTKILVKSSNREIDPPSVVVFENFIHVKIKEREFQKLQNDLDLDDSPQYDPNLYDDVDDEFISLDLCDYFVNIERGNETKVWRKQEFTEGDWIAHFLGIFNVTMIDHLKIDTVSLSNLETVKRFIPKCQKLRISEKRSRKFTKIVFLKLATLAEKVEIDKNIFDDDDNDIFKYLTLNLKSVSFHDWQKPFKLELDDLLVLNITHLTIGPTNITGKELNRFMKLWMKGNLGFYRPEHIFLSLRKEMDRGEVLRGIKFQIVGHECRLKRADGNELTIDIGLRHVSFTFRR